jgi:hypothetical protein
MIDPNFTHQSRFKQRSETKDIVVVNFDKDSTRGSEPATSKCTSHQLESATKGGPLF